MSTPWIRQHRAKRYELLAKVREDIRQSAARKQLTLELDRAMYGDKHDARVDERTEAKRVDRV